MLYVSLFFSGILLLIVNLAAWRSRSPVRVTLAAGVGATLLPMFIWLVLPGVFWHAVSLLAIVILWRVLGLKPQSLAPLSILATVICYGLVMWSKYREIVHFQEQHPRESLETRVPLPKPISRPVALPVTTDQNLNALETWLEREVDYIPYYRDRGRHLLALHEHTVDVFVNSPGFGMTRMSYVTEHTLKGGLRNDPPIPQPGEPTTLTSPGELDQSMAGPHSKSLMSMHDESLRDFVHPSGFGHVKDRSYVLGFQGHRFSKVPAMEGWKVRTVELIGLLLHAEPVAYVSAHLPRMDELRKAPTRPLDHFEHAGLAEFRKGEDLFVAGNQQELRMLGALRSAQQCGKCHGGERGDLLGVFSYTLRR